MSDLHRRLVRTGVPVEGQQTRRAEPIQDTVHRSLVHVDRPDLGASHASTDVLGPFSEGQEPEEELTRRFPGNVVRGAVQLLGPCRSAPETPPIAR